MKNLKLRKILLTICCAMLLVTLSVGATFAYLTSKTDTVVNTFTVGNVKITLDETDVDLYGKKESEARVTENTYKLLPGHSYIKDPTVHVDENSEDAYVRMLVTVESHDKLGEVVGFGPNGHVQLQRFVNGWDNQKWQFTGVTFNADRTTAVYEYRYVETETDKATAGNTLPALFTQVVVPNDLSNEDLAKLANLKINVVAHAIQADGFEDAAAAWNAWN